MLRPSTSRTFSPELELLDQLEGGQLRYLVVEEQVFPGNREHALRSIGHMLRARLIELLGDGALVPEWQVATWRRRPDEEDTMTGLANVVIGITGKGVEWYVMGNQEQ